MPEATLEWNYFSHSDKPVRVYLQIEYASPAPVLLHSGPYVFKVRPQDNGNTVAAMVETLLLNSTRPLTRKGRRTIHRRLPDGTTFYIGEVDFEEDEELLTEGIRKELTCGLVCTRLSERGVRDGHRKLSRKSKTRRVA